MIRLLVILSSWLTLLGAITVNVMDRFRDVCRVLSRSCLLIMDQVDRDVLWGSTKGVWQDVITKTICLCGIQLIALGDPTIPNLLVLCGRVARNLTVRITRGQALVIFQGLASRVIDNRVGQWLLISGIVNIDDNILAVWRDGCGTSLSLVRRVASNLWTSNIREVAISWRPLDVTNQVTRDLILALGSREGNALCMVNRSNGLISTLVEVVNRLANLLRGRDGVKIVCQVDVVVLIRLRITIEASGRSTLVCLGKFVTGTGIVP